MKSRNKSACNGLGKVKAHQDQHSNRMGDPVVATLGIIHGDSCSPPLLSEEVTQKLLAQTGVDGGVAFPTTMLIGRNSAPFLSMGEDSLAYQFVVDLELRRHELDQPHLVNKVDAGLLQDLNVSDSLPGCGREARGKWKGSQEGINRIEGWIKASKSECVFY